MNLLRFLKSTRGAIKPLNALLISGAAGAGFFFIANTAANHQIQAERQIRSLSSIEQSSPREGMQRQGGMLTSINVRDARNQVATAEERAAMGGNSALDRYNANQKALGNLESSFGRAAEFSDSDAGLNTGNREYTEGDTRFSVGNPRAVNMPRRGSGSYDDSDDYGAASSSAGQSSFATASMARASGSNFGGTSGPISSGGSGVANGGTAGGSGGEGARLSGSMPGGSNIVSQMGLDGNAARTSTSSFGAANRNTRGTGSRVTGTGKGELSDILKKSAAAAANANASANEGGRAFLASARSSGGLSVDGSGNTGYATSSDFEAVTANKLKAVGRRLSDEEKNQEERKQDQKDLLRQFLWTLGGSIAAIVLISTVLKAIPWAKWILVGVVAGFNAWLFVEAAQFYNKWGAYGGTAIVNLAKVFAPLLTAAAVYSAIDSSAWSKIWGAMKANFKQMFSLAGITSTVMSQVGNTAKGAINEAVDNKKK